MDLWNSALGCTKQIEIDIVQRFLNEVLYYVDQLTVFLMGTPFLKIESKPVPKIYPLEAWIHIKVPKE